MDTEKKIKILEVWIDNLNKEEVLNKIKYFLEEDKFHQIATVNPEFILEAQKNSEFKNILNNSDLRVADGVGIWFSFLRFGKLLKIKITGADLMEKILKIAEEKNIGIFLAANQEGLSMWEETRGAILKKYPKLKIGGINLNKKNPKFKIQNPNYGIVFCNFGAPDQEKFIDSLKLLENSKIKLAMGVGGSFDFLVGKIKRAPKFMRAVGLEWLWRLLQQPRRIKRIFNAVIIFPIKIIFTR